MPHSLDMISSNYIIIKGDNIAFPKVLEANIPLD